MSLSFDEIYFQFCFFHSSFFHSSHWDSQDCLESNCGRKLNVLQCVGSTTAAAARPSSGSEFRDNLTERTAQNSTNGLKFKYIICFAVEYEKSGDKHDRLCRSDRNQIDRKSVLKRSSCCCGTFQVRKINGVGSCSTFFLEERHWQVDGELLLTAFNQKILSQDTQCFSYFHINKHKTLLFESFMKISLRATRLLNAITFFEPATLMLTLINWSTTTQSCCSQVCSFRIMSLKRCCHFISSVFAGLIAVGKHSLYRLYSHNTTVAPIQLNVCRAEVCVWFVHAHSCDHF